MLVGFVRGPLARLGKKAAPARRALDVTPPALVAALARVLAVTGDGGAHAAAAAPPVLTVIPAPPGQVGNGVSTEGSATVSHGSQQITESIAIRRTGFAEQCPDTTGVATGTAGNAFNQSFDVTGLPFGARLMATGSGDSSATLTGHVGADGKLSYYDADVHGEIRGDGTITVLGHAFRTLDNSLVVHIVLLHLLPGVPLSKQLTPEHVGQVSLTGHENDGTPVSGLATDEEGNLTESFAQGIIITLASIIKDSGDAAYASAQRHWYDDDACLKARFTPDSLQQVDPGSVHNVSVSVASVRDGSDVRIPLTASASNGSVSPGHGTAGPSAPAQFTFTV